MNVILSCIRPENKVSPPSLFYSFVKVRDMTPDGLERFSKIFLAFPPPQYIVHIRRLTQLHIQHLL